MTLPEGWAATTLGDCQGKTSSVDPRKDPDTEFDLFSVPAYSADKPDRARGGEIGSTKQQVRAGDVLLCKIVPHIRRGWVVPPRAERPQIASGEWIVFRDNALEPEFLRRFVLSDQFHEQFMQTVSGVGGSLMRARPAEVGKIGVPVPPAAEQRRIVAKLDALTARLARARAELERVSALVERLRQSAFAICFDADAISRQYGERVQCCELSDFVSSTFYGPRIAEAAYVSTGVPTLRTSDIGAWGQLNPQDPPQVKVSDKEMDKWSLREGDLIVTRTGATIGKCALYKSEMGPALPSAYLIRIRLKLNLVLPEYVLLFLLSPSGQEQLVAGRTATAQPNINARAILGLSLPAPSIAVQKSVVVALRSMLARANRMEVEVTRARALIDRLEAAILGRAFRGELVPQDPGDEPASVLLDRIRAQRAAAPKPQRGRRAKKETS